MRFNALKKTCLIVFFIGFTSLFHLPAADRVFFDKNFMKSLSSTRVIERDSYFESRINSIVQARAAVVSFDKAGRYKRLFRLMLEDTEAPAYKLKIIYNVFLNKEDTLTLLTTGDDFEFSGQLISCAPLNTGRTAYVLDIVLEEGALLIE